MSARVGIDAGGKRLQIRAKRRRLLPQPQPRARRYVVYRHPTIALELFGAVIFGGTPARLRVELGEDVPMTVRHRPAEAVEKIRDGFGVDVSDTISIPEDLRAMRGPVGRQCAGGAREREQAQ